MAQPKQSMFRVEIHPEDGSPPKIAGLTISGTKATVRLDSDTTFTLTPPKGQKMSTDLFLAEASKWVEILDQVMGVVAEIQALEIKANLTTEGSPGGSRFRIEQARLLEVAALTFESGIDIKTTESWLLGDWPEPAKHQAWLDSAAPSELAAWVVGSQLATKGGSVIPPYSDLWQALTSESE